MGSSFLRAVLDSGVASSSEGWGRGLLYQPHHNDQALVYETGDCLAVRAFLQMAGLAYEVIPRANAEHMSPSGELPLLREGKFVLAGFDTIVDYAGQKGKNLAAFLPDEELADLKADLALAKATLRPAEEYIMWCHEPTLHSVTIPRYGSVYAWPLNRVLPLLKRRQVLSRLRELGKADMSLQDIQEELSLCCRALSRRLGEKRFFFSEERATELDAFVFGHLFALLTTELPDVDLVPVLQQFPNLMAFSQRVEKAYFSR